MSSRAERRRAQKAERKTVTYHFTQSQMDAWKKQLLDEVLAQANARVEKQRQEDLECILSQGIVYVLGLSLKVLREEFGYGGVRLDRFAQAVITEYNEGDEDLETLRKRIYAETGVEFRMEGET